MDELQRAAEVTRHGSSASIPVIPRSTRPTSGRGVSVETCPTKYLKMEINSLRGISGISRHQCRDAVLQQFEISNVLEQ